MGDHQAYYQQKDGTQMPVQGDQYHQQNQNYLQYLSQQEQQLFHQTQQYGAYGAHGAPEYHHQQQHSQYPVYGTFGQAEAVAAQHQQPPRKKPKKEKTNENGDPGPKSKGNEPKKPKTGYIIFSSEMRERIKASLHVETNGNYRSQDVIKRIGEIWRGMTTEEKKVWDAKALDERRRYEYECAAMGVKPQLANATMVVEEEPKRDNGPKKPKTGYIIFSNEIREKN
mmetsp:Transcript_17620/g.29629  ORF Transcript_17620/g.29629 Transcript_17620/m.29629 type:complete len:226 (-) Transcript_17620:343-1020(-)